MNQFAGIGIQSDVRKAEDLYGSFDREQHERFDWNEAAQSKKLASVVNLPRPGARKSAHR